jgi:ankyrin repeat protein
MDDEQLLWHSDEKVKEFLSRPDIDVNKSYMYGVNGKGTLLSLTSVTGRDEIVSLLLSHPDIDVNKPDYAKCSPLYMAALNGRENVVKLLLSHPNIDVNQYNRYRETPLNVAASHGHAKIVELLLECPIIEVNGINDETGMTALHHASFYGHGKVVKQILSTRENVDVKSKSKLYARGTAAEIANENGHPDIAKLINDYEQRPNEVRNALRIELGLNGKLSFFLYFFFLPKNI